MPDATDTAYFSLGTPPELTELPSLIPEAETIVGPSCLLCPSAIWTRHWGSKPRVNRGFFLCPLHEIKVGLPDYVDWRLVEQAASSNALFCPDYVPAMPCSMTPPPPGESKVITQGPDNLVQMFRRLMERASKGFGSPKRKTKRGRRQGRA